MDVSILCLFILDMSFIFNNIFYWRCQLYYDVIWYVYDVKRWICLWGRVKRIVWRVPVLLTRGQHLGITALEGAITARVTEVVVF